MGKRIDCKIGDVFGIYEVIEEPYMNGEHQFAKVRCTKCGNIQDLSVSEIKNRQKRGCRFCKGELRRIYPQPKVGDIYKNWEVIEEGVFDKQRHAWFYKCKCLLCGHIQMARKDQLYTKVKRCDNCRYKAKEVEAQRHLKIQEVKRNQPFLSKLHHVQTSATNRGIPVTITENDLKELWEKQEHRCAITGDIIPSFKDASIDRIDSEFPYEINNIQIVTKQANISKHRMTMEQLYEFCRKVLNHANQQPSQGLKSLKGSETNS